MPLALSMTQCAIWLLRYPFARVAASSSREVMPWRPGCKKGEQIGLSTGAELEWALVKPAYRRYGAVLIGAVEGCPLTSALMANRLDYPAPPVRLYRDAETVSASERA